MRHLDDEARIIRRQRATGQAHKDFITCTQLELDEYNAHAVQWGHDAVTDSIFGVPIKLVM